MGKNALAIMFKVPEPGKVKTRLVPPLTYGQASALYECFLKDIFNTARGVAGADIYGAFTGRVNGDGDYGVELFEQEGLNLGGRIYNVFSHLFQRGYQKIAVIGSDSPDLPPEYIREAFGLLASASLVLGPAKDGGYYLIAMDRLMKEPFNEIPWSTDKVLEETIKRAQEASIPFKLLKPWHDIDTVQDLMLLNGKAAPISADFLKKLEFPLKT